ncbi:MAG: copper amine oxidase N-terminal domain-containing protein [Clostridiaceae bacterium]|nr:copper amine oxidase N-terminal domain-containing protein [Clostridiaceae bacterium]
MKKRILGVLLACVLALGTLPAVQAAGLPASPEDVWGMDGVFVQLNGAFLTFPDAQSEIRNGRVMAPFRTIAEALGMEVAFREGAIAASNDVVQLRFRVGEASYWKLTEDGAPSTAAPMDTAPYIKTGRTYVPVRFFAEALGLQVEWCENTVVILDRERRPCVRPVRTDGNFPECGRIHGERLLSRRPAAPRCDRACPQHHKAGAEHGCVPHPAGRLPAGCTARGRIGA